MPFKKKLSEKENNLNKIIRKSCVYGVNYGARLIGNSFNESLKLGHPYSALGFGLSDLIMGVSEKWERGNLNKFIKFGGFTYFSFLTINNLVDFARGDYSFAKDFPFNLSMALSLGKDLKEIYKESDSEISNLPEDISYFYEDLKNIFNRKERL